SGELETSNSVGCAHSVGCAGETANSFCGFADDAFAAGRLADEDGIAPPTAAADAACADFTDARVAPDFLVSPAELLLRPRASSTAARKSTSILKGWPEEYSAWNITFHD